jgi:hypothetical protein
MRSGINPGAAASAEIAIAQTVERDLAVIRMEETEEARHQCRLAGAVRADETDDFSRREREIDPAKHLVAAEPLPDSARLDHVWKQLPSRNDEHEPVAISADVTVGSYAINAQDERIPA